jgi:photosystem II stability/assembly factor-like uncharacterized protein
LDARISGEGRRRISRSRKLGVRPAICDSPGCLNDKSQNRTSDPQPKELMPRRLTIKTVSLAACALLIASSGLPFRHTPDHAPARTPLTPGVLKTWSMSLLRNTPGLSVTPSLFPSTRVREPREALEEDAEGRGDWFTFQRAYPSNSIPPDARIRAWSARPGYSLDSVLVPQATQTWRPIGPAATVSAWYPFWGLTSGRVNAIAVSPSNSSIVLIGSSTGGIWRSTDGGDTFVPVSDDQVDMAVGSIAFSKSNPSIAYAGMGDTKAGYLGSGVLKSTNEGRTWVRVSDNSLPSLGTIAKLEIDPNNPGRVYLAQYSSLAGSKVTSSGLFVSTDGGTKWKRVLGGAPRDVAIDPHDSRVLYAGLSRIDKDADPAFGLYRSTDSGDTWANLFAAQYDITRRRDFRVAVTATNPKLIYAYFGGFVGSSLDARLRVSSDAGATWTDRNLATVDTAQLGYNTYLAVDPRDSMTIYIGSRDLYKSTDGGESWTNLTRNFYDSGVGFQYAPGGSATHVDQHALTFSPANPNEYYVGNDGGVSKTTDNGDTFRSLNATLSLTQFIGIALHPTNPAISYGGTQDNGTQLRSADSNWFEVLSGDGGRVVVNPLDPSVVFMTYIRGDIFRVIDSGQNLDLQVASSGTFGEFFLTPRIAFYPPFVGNGVDATLYFGTWRLFISNNLGNSWFSPSGFVDLTKGSTEIGFDVLSAIGVARSNTNVIYTGSAQGRAMRSTNGGQTWLDVTAGLPNRSITSIAVDPSDPSTAYLTVSGFNSGHVFRTTNTGGSWVDISGSLPDVPANALLVDPTDSSIVYLGTDIGVFRSTTRGNDWRSFNRGMPPVVVHGFSANSSGVIQVATYGRGAYELGGSIDRPVITAADFNGKKRLEINGSTFGEAPKVIINGEDRSFRITESSDTSIVMVGKIKKLGLKSGENTIQVITSDNLSSNVFTIQLSL